jgi:glycerol-3-phosphate cytidylyltransferase
VRKVGYVPGVFDMFHIGHLNILRNASRECDHLIAGVVSDEIALLAKGRPPVVPLAERLEIVRSIRYVDEAYAETEPDKIAVWQRLRFNMIIKGDDWQGTAKGERLERDMASIGAEVVYLPYTAHTSSTLLRCMLDEPPAAREASGIA